MKTIIALVIALSMPAARAEKIEYQVSKAGADKGKLERVFEAVRTQEQPPEKRGEEYEVAWKISATEYIVWKRVGVRDPIVRDRLSSIGGYNGGTPRVTYTMETRMDVSYYLKLTDPMEKADGEIIQGISTQVTGETKTLNGSTHRVIAQGQAPEGEVFTKEKFVADLKAGKTWTIIGFQEKSCHRCFGDGKLSATEQEARCTDCNGKGITKIDYVVKW